MYNYLIPHLTRISKQIKIKKKKKGAIVKDLDLAVDNVLFDRARQIAISRFSKQSHTHGKKRTFDTPDSKSYLIFEEKDLESQLFNPTLHYVTSSSPFFRTPSTTHIRPSLDPVLL